MNCWNHTDTPAVAQCAECGKFLCKECAMKHQLQAHQILCDECFAEFRAEQEKEEYEQQLMEAHYARKEKRSRLLCLIGTIIGEIITITMAVILCEGMPIPDTILVFLILINMGCMPYGWRAMGTLFGVRSWWGSFGQFAVKYCVSWFIGGPCLIYHIFHYVIPERLNKQK